MAVLAGCVVCMVYTCILYPLYVCMVYMPCPLYPPPPHSAQAHAMLPRHMHVIGACTPHRRATPNPTPSPSPNPNQVQVAAGRRVQADNGLSKGGAYPNPDPNLTHP